jgi:hypothetical protein
MKRIITMMAMIAISICTATQVSAKERVAPTLTKYSSADLKDGMKVALFNNGYENYLYYPDSTTYSIIPSSSPSIVTIHIPSPNRFQFQLTSEKYVGVYSSNSYIEANPLDRVYGNFVVRDSLDGCVIQLAPEWSHYNASYFVGMSDNSRIYRNKTGENIIWSIISALDAARMKLYNALVASDSYGYNVDKFEEIYANENSTLEELDAAATALNNAISLSNYVKDAWGGEYPILFIDDEHYAWPRSDGNILRRWNNMSSGEQQTLVAVVDVDQEVALAYNPYNNNGQWYEEDYYNYNESQEYGNNHYFVNRYTEYYATMEVYIDDQLVRTINHHELGLDWMFFEPIPKGKHTIKWVGMCPEGRNNQYIDLQWIAVYKTPIVSVNLREAGSLGLEVLASTDSNGEQINRIQDVRKLKIKGPMNEDDWTQIDNMPSLFSIDLSEAIVTTIPDNMFNRDSSNGGKSSKNNLFDVKLPNMLQKVGANAFRCSYIREMEFPSTLTAIGAYAFTHTLIPKAILHEGLKTIENDAFWACMHMEEVSLPDNVTLGTDVFNRCFSLKKANWPKLLTTVPTSTFKYCHSLEDMSLPEGITEIGQDAFNRCWAYDPTLPTTLRTIGYRSFFNSGITEVNLQRGISIGFAAFKYCDIQNLVIPENASLGNLCFADCKQLETVDFPSSYYTIGNGSPILRYDDALKTVRLKSSTMMVGDYKDRFFWDCGSDFTVQVPDYLVNIYKQDSYWKEYKLEGFGTDEVNHWYVRNPLVLTYRDCWKGNPNVTIQSNTGTLHIKDGGDPININDLFIDWSSQLLCEREGVSIKGDYTHCYYAPDDVWYFISLPFNFKPKDVTTENGAHIALRYYDGANRAENGATGSWKTLPADTTVSAGSGFILRTSKRDYVFFHALNDGDKQNIVSTAEFAKSLQINDSEEAANKGWNLVGNPYQTYFNIHKLNTTAPITVYELTYGYGYNRMGEWSSSYAYGGNYKAYSIVDDDYALPPNGAFFLQCPDENNKVTFPTVGKQLTSVIEDQNGVKEYMPQPELRKLIDLCLFADGTESFYDQTRVVFNPTAQLSYERMCDASKFANEDQTIPQLYSLGDDDIRYAINERPVEDGTVRLGIYIPVDGTYTFHVSRNRHAGTILLYDELEDVTADITDTDYIFHATAGTTDKRFRLVAQTLVTDIVEIPESELIAIATEGGLQTNSPAQIYGTDGRLVARTQGGFVPVCQGVYIVRQGKKSVKVSVK